MMRRLLVHRRRVTNRLVEPTVVLASKSKCWACVRIIVREDLYHGSSDLYSEWIVVRARKEKGYIYGIEKIAHPKIFRPKNNNNNNNNGGSVCVGQRYALKHCQETHIFCSIIRKPQGSNGNPFYKNDRFPYAESNAIALYQPLFVQKL